MKRTFSSRISWLVLPLCLATPLLHAVPAPCDTPVPGRNAAKALPQIPALNWEPRSDWASVKDFGAKGDGKTDDTAAIQKAFDGFKEGATIYLPAGTYR